MIDRIKGANILLREGGREGGLCDMMHTIHSQRHAFSSNYWITKYETFTYCNV